MMKKIAIEITNRIIYNISNQNESFHDNFMSKDFWKLLLMISSKWAKATKNNTMSNS